MRPLLALASLALLLCASEATAQKDNTPTVNVPGTKNPHFRKIAYLYGKLEYEAAIELISTAERHLANKEQDRIWLELMKGVLHHSLRDGAKAEAAFSKVLEQYPYNSLPVQNPSQSLHERFDKVRAEVLRSRALKNGSTTTPPPRPHADSSAPRAPSEQPAAKQQPVPAQGPADQTQAVSKPTPSQMELLGRLDALEKQERQSKGGQLPPKLEILFEHVRGLTQEARTPDARKSVAQWIDSMEGWFKNDKPEERQPAALEDLSEEALLARLSALEARCQKQTGMKLNPTIGVLLTQARLLIRQTETPMHLKSLALWVQTLEVFLIDGGHEDLASSPSANRRASDETQRQAGSLSGISHGTLIKRAIGLTGWLHAQSRGRATYSDLLNELEQIAQAIVASPTGHERMLLAIRLDQWEERVRQHLASPKQSANSP